MANFARCLSAFGWDPQVLTIRDEDVQELDVERRRGLEDIPVHQARVLPTMDRMWGDFRRRQRARSAPAASAPPAPRPTAPSNGVRRERLTQRLKRYILSFLVLPDRERGWIVPAVTAAVRRIRRDRIQWIMTSCPPYSGHLVGLLVKLLTGARWVADFRDPWMTTGSKRLFPTSAASKRIESWLERKVIENAELVLFNVERLRNAYRARYRHVAPEKLVFIPNAVSPRVSTGSESRSKYEVFTLSYTGSLYLGRSPEPVCRALAQLISEGKIGTDDVRLLLVGHCREVDGVPTAVVARKYGLESVVEVRDPVPYDEAMEIVSRSHLAMLYAPDLPFQIPAKVYDYLSTGTRILAIAQDGGTADLIRDTESGRAFSPHEIDGIAAFIHAEMTARRSGSEFVSAASLARFDARHITEELAGYLGRPAERVGA